jgi:FlaA1/EpsC-like NDP-sugar epimerase
VGNLDLKSFYNNKSLLVFGGTGTIGSEIVSQILDFNPALVRIFSNSENELWETKLKFANSMDETVYLDSIKNLDFVIGDIRDYKTVKKAMKNINYVFNAAAIKHVAISEKNPIEAVHVNIHGIDNIIQAAKECSVEKYYLYHEY